MVLTDNNIYLKVIWLGMENGVEVFVGQKDNYEVKGFFASGGMGDIFEALDSHGNEVLIKVPKKFSAGRNDPMNNQVISEIENLKLLIHPNVVKYVDTGKNGSKPFLVMEKIYGISLKEHIEDIDYSYEFATNVCKGVISALQYLRTRRVVHRDISHLNIIISDNIPKIIDFSTSIRIPEEMDSVKLKGSRIGTENFSAPEQLNEGTVYIDSDIYSLGAVTYYSLTGLKPEKYKKDVKQIERYSDLPLYYIISNTLQEKRADRIRDLSVLSGVLDGNIDKK